MSRRVRPKPWAWWRVAPNDLTPEEVERAKAAPPITTPVQPATLRSYKVTIRGCRHYAVAHSRIEAEAAAKADHDVYCRVPGLESFR